MPSSVERAIKEEDRFLIETAAKILGGSRVATTTAERLSTQNIDVERLASLLKTRGAESEVGGMKFKLIDADPETPQNFGVLVRLITPLTGLPAARGAPQ
jgi:hypothetical protein